MRLARPRHGGPRCRRRERTCAWRSPIA